MERVEAQPATKTQAARTTIGFQHFIGQFVLVVLTCRKEAQKAQKFSRFFLRPLCLFVAIHFSPFTVVSYLTPSGTGTATGTVVPSFPWVCRVESTATNAVKADINP